MSYKDDIALMAHLIRRAGFGAPRAELEARVTKGYEATVEELLEPEKHSIPENDEDLLFRHSPETMLPGGVPLPGQANYAWQMINTKRPLQEKIGLFWHHVFATGNSKVDNCDQLLTQIKHVPQAWDGQLPESAGRAGQEPGHDLLAGQQREPQRCTQRELG